MKSWWPGITLTCIPWTRLDAAISAPAPDLDLSARMLNEFVYCPRLFYYEYVEGIFVHNADTLRGAQIHRRVDSGSGKMPPAPRRSRGGRRTPAPAYGEGTTAPGTSRRTGATPRKPR